MNILQQKISETLLNAPSGVNGVFYGNKTINGELTNNKSIIYYVSEKKPLSALSPEEIIPQSLNLNNQEYITDVVESAPPVINQCYAVDGIEPIRMRSRIRPLSGGIEISPLDSWEQTSPYYFNYGVGTVGFLAKDNTDNKLVGVTNSHVMVLDAFVSNERDPLSGAYNIIDNITFSYENGLNTTISTRILQFGSSTGSVNFFNDKIGVPKRYVPISENENNKVDGAIFTISSNVFDVNSNSQAYLLGNATLNMPFATSEEIDNLPIEENFLYSAGSRTGPKGDNCPLVSYEIGSTFIAYPKQGVSTLVLFQDCIKYRFVDQSNLPIWFGDSGSALVANINNVNKIVGLVFAGNSGGTEQNPTSTYALACRIDHVANELNISAWDGSTISTSDSNPSYSYFLRPLSDTRTSIVSGGKTFYQVGTVLTDEAIATI